MTSLHLWGAISRSFALPAVNRLSLMTRLFTNYHFSGALCVLASVLTY